MHELGIRSDCRLHSIQRSFQYWKVPRSALPTHSCAPRSSLHSWLWTYIKLSINLGRHIHSCFNSRCWSDSLHMFRIATIGIQAHHEILQGHFQHWIRVSLLMWTSWNRGTYFAEYNVTCIDKHPPGSRRAVAYIHWNPYCSWHCLCKHSCRAWDCRNIKQPHTVISHHCHNRELSCNELTHECSADGRSGTCNYRRYSPRFWWQNNSLFQNRA